MCFDGVWIPLVTPLRADAGQPVDTAALQRLVRHLAAQGVAGFVACGSTGEAAMLSAAEQQQVLAATLQAAGGLPVLMGLSGVRPAEVAARARALAAEHPLAGFLLTPPAYVKPSQAGLVDFFHTVAEASPVPIVAYDIPARTGVRIAPASLRALADHPRIQALKDCSGQRETAHAVLDDGRLALLAGNDDELFDQLARGAVGAITASAHLATGAFVRLLRLLRPLRAADATGAASAPGGAAPAAPGTRGPDPDPAPDLAAARRLWRALAPVTAAAFAEPNPAPVKAALARQGWIGDGLRAPMQAAQAGCAEALLGAAARAEAAAVPVHG